jgi:hypothetical protein
LDQLTGSFALNQVAGQELAGAAENAFTSSTPNVSASSPAFFLNNLFPAIAPAYEQR